MKPTQEPKLIKSTNVSRADGFLAQKKGEGAIV